MKFAEQLVLLSSLMKWTVYATTTGVIVGIGTAIFIKLLSGAIVIWAVNPYYYLFIPIILFFNSLLVWLLARDVEAGSNQAIEAIHRRMGYLPLREVPVKLIATIITIAGGGSAGKEGPAAHLGATLACAWGRLIKANAIDCRKMVVCGFSAGFAAVFGTPIAGAIFGVEVLFIGKIKYDALYPAIVAGLTSYYVACSVGISYFYKNVSVQPSCKLLLYAILLGIFSGLVAILFIKTVKIVRAGFKMMPIWKPLKGLVGGSLLALIGFLGSSSYLGLGMGLLEAAVQGEVLPQGSFIWKTIATAITLGCGGNGGIITPVLVVGATTGNLFGQIIEGMDISTCSVIGIAALLAGAVNTPFAAMVMTIELFGGEILPYVAIGCFVSFLISGHRSVYPSQIVAISKSTSLVIELGQAVGSIDQTIINLRTHTLYGCILKRVYNPTKKGKLMN